MFFLRSKTGRIEAGKVPAVILVAAFHITVHRELKVNGEFAYMTEEEVDRARFLKVAVLFGRSH